MLISPPFLPPRGNLSEEDWIRSAMPAGPPGGGAFPVSHLLEWHGGLHLAAPMGAGGSALPVCAIADGTVVYVRQRTSADSPDEPLNYGPGYTSDAVVVVRHDTESGTGAQGQTAQVRFYSVYMHLFSIRPTVLQGRRIERRAEIGQAGHIYGEPNLIHFEICCDDASLASLVGRSAGEVALSADGRSNLVLGEIYFHLPAGTPVYPSQPLAQFAQAMSASASGPQPLAASHTTTAACLVGIRHAGGSPAPAQRGGVTVTTYQPDGTRVDQPLQEAEGEYEVRTRAKTISEAHPATARPTPEAVYELLRFGRTIGSEVLAPADVPHWRQVAYPGGRGWVNLNATGVHKFSDADFPQWKGWALIGDDTNGDSRCDSPALRRIVYTANGASLQPGRAQAVARLADPAVQQRLSRTICKFPSEWDASTIDQRWSWLKQQDAENPQPLSEDDYGHLKAHVGALCFALPELFSAQWCFDPREFILQFRQSCVWPDLLRRWTTARAGHVLPLDEDLQKFGKTALYEHALRSSLGATLNHQDQRDPESFRALDRGEAVIFGMRVHTDVDANTGRGLWDDRVTQLMRDDTGLLEMKYRGRYTTEPSGRYLDGGANLSPNKQEGMNVGGTAHLDIGRLMADKTYQYRTFNHPAIAKFGSPRFGGNRFNIMKKTAASQVERLVVAQAPINEARGTWQSGAAAGYSEQQTMHFHKGYNNMTGSAGCQTFPHAGTDTFEHFMGALEPLTADSRFQYVLVGL
jgi:hypothetical protein